MPNLPPLEGLQVNFLPRTAVPAAGTTVFNLLQNSDAQGAQNRFLKLMGIRAMPLRAQFEYGAAGTTAKFFLQSSIDAQVWHDVVCFAFLLVNSTKVAHLFAAQQVPAALTDGTLADDTISAAGPPATYWRTKAVITGAYTGTFITIKGAPEK